MVPAPPAAPLSAGTFCEPRTLIGGLSLHLIEVSKVPMPSSVAGRHSATGM